MLIGNFAHFHGIIYKFIFAKQRYILGPRIIGHVKFDSSPIRTRIISKEPELHLS